MRKLFHRSWLLDFCGAVIDIGRVIAFARSLLLVVGLFALVQEVSFAATPNGPTLDETRTEYASSINAPARMPALPGSWKASLRFCVRIGTMNHAALFSSPLLKGRGSR